MFILLLISFKIIISLFIQTITWRVFKPKNEYFLIFIIFNTVFLSSLIFIKILSINLPIHDWIHIVIIFYFFMFAYIIAYTSIEGDSPSIIIAIEIFKSNKKGLTSEDLENKITDERFLNPRIETILNNKIAYIKNKKIFISKKGHLSIILMNIIHLYLGKSSKTS